MAADTHRGPHHCRNEDCFLSVSTPPLGTGMLAIADGVGSTNGGEIASYFTLKALLTGWQQYINRTADAEHAQMFLAKTLQQANAKVFATNSYFGPGMQMATTVVAAVFVPGQAVIVHAGDSRCYRWRNNNLSLLTRDHTWIEEMVRNGRLDAKDACQHPLANTLSNCIGPLPQLRLAIQNVSCKPGDRFLLCSDGASKLLTTTTLADCLANAATAHNVVQCMLRTAMARGEIDDISVGVAFIG